MKKLDHARLFWDSYGYEIVVGIFLLIGIGIGLLGGWFMWGKF